MLPLLCTCVRVYVCTCVRAYTRLRIKLTQNERVKNYKNLNKKIFSAKTLTIIRLLAVLKKFFEKI